MIPLGAQSEEGLHHLLHCREDQCLQEPLWKQTHELSTDALDFQGQGEQKQWFDNKGLCVSSPILLGFSLPLGGCILSGVLEFALSGVGFSCLGSLLF